MWQQMEMHWLQLVGGVNNYLPQYISIKNLITGAVW